MIFHFPLHRLDAKGVRKYHESSMLASQASGDEHATFYDKLHLRSHSYYEHR
jgi:hypothetical protein